MGTALKILVTPVSDFEESGDDNSKFSLSRVEIASLFNAFGRYVTTATSTCACRLYHRMTTKALDHMTTTNCYPVFIGIANRKTAHWLQFGCHITHLGRVIRMNMPVVHPFLHLFISNMISHSSCFFFRLSTSIKYIEDFRRLLP